VILVTVGQRHEAPLLPALLDAGAVRRSGPAGRPGRGRPRKRPERLVADKGYSYPSVRAELRRRGIAAVIPTRSNQRRRPGFDRVVYAWA
jgi:Transposase DDE domain